MLRSLPRSLTAVFINMERQEDRYMPTNITDIFQAVTRKEGGNFQVTVFILALIL